MFRSRLKAFTPRQKNGLILLSFGFFLLLVGFLWSGYQTFHQDIPSFSQTPEMKETYDENDFPEKVLIPAVGIDLPVFPAQATNDQWEVSEEGASYLLGSGVPGKVGNVVIYGHNKNSLLGPIRWLSEGREIVVINREGEGFAYEVVETKTVSSEAVGILAPTEDVTLTLYTCTGFWDRERFIIIAKLKPKEE